MNVESVKEATRKPRLRWYSRNSIENVGGRKLAGLVLRVKEVSSNRMWVEMI